MLCQIFAEPAVHHESAGIALTVEDRSIEDAVPVPQYGPIIHPIG